MTPAGRPSPHRSRTSGNDSLQRQLQVTAQRGRQRQRGDSGVTAGAQLPPQGTARQVLQAPGLPRHAHGRRVELVVLLGGGMEGGGGLSALRTAGAPSASDRIPASPHLPQLRRNGLQPRVGGGDAVVGVEQQLQSRGVRAAELQHLQVWRHSGSQRCHVPEPRQPRVPLSHVTPTTRSCVTSLPCPHVTSMSHPHLTPLPCSHAHQPHVSTSH